MGALAYLPDVRCTDVLCQCSHASTSGKGPYAGSPTQSPCFTCPGEGLGGTAKCAASRDGAGPLRGGNAQVDQEWVVADAVRRDVPNSSWVNTIVTQAAQAATQAATEAMTTVLAQALAPIQGAQSLQAGELQRQAQALQALMQAAAGHQPPGGSAVVHLPMNDPDVMHES